MRGALVKLLAITACALIFRLALLPLVHNPGINDPAHYFNLGRRLAEGRGFTIDYVWHYARLPVEQIHPIDHWMPLPGLAAALGMVAGGSADIQSALALFVLAGSLLPMLVYAASRQFGLSNFSALAAAAFAAVLPELVLNSLRPDSTILNACFVLAALVMVKRAMASSNRLGFLLGGFLFGLTHLTRNDSIFLFALLLAYLALAGRFGDQRTRKSDLFLLAVAFGITIFPWHLRNLQEIGSLGSPLTSQMPFMVEPRDHYAYGTTHIFQSLFARQSIADLLGKRLFELAAALKQMAVSLQAPVAILVPVGLFTIISKGNRKLFLQVMPVLLWAAGILMIYPILLPILNQSGSFKKAFLTISPLLIPLGVYALERLNTRRHWRNIILLLSIGWLAWSSYALVKEETAFADRYHASIRILVERLESLPDRSGDGEIRLMTQDTFVMSYYGYQSIVIPLASREATLALAQEYDIDYLQLPAARPALDSLYLGEERDSRFELALRVTDAGEKPFELYGFNHNAPAPP